MTIELVSEVGGRAFKMAPKAFGKLLHMARLHGWCPQKLPDEWPSHSWNTEIILPHIGPYMPGRVSEADAKALRKALTRALATGDVAADGTVHLASQALLLVASSGSFTVRFDGTETLDPRAAIGVTTC